MFEIAVLTLTASLNFLLGLVVMLKNPRSTTNKLFFFLTTSIAVWSIVNYFSVHPVFFSQLLWIRLVLFCGGLLNLSVFLTFVVFPGNSIPAKLKKVTRLAIYTSLVIVPMTLTPIVFKSLRFTGGEAQPEPSFGIGLFLLHTLLLVGGGVYMIVKKYRNSTGAIKHQLRFVLLGTAGTFFLIVLTNFLFVILFNITAFVSLGPAATLVFSGFMAYAIVAHKLFDIRAAAARATVYLLVTAFVALIYIGIVNIIRAVVFPDLKIPALQTAINITLTVTLVIFYPYLKRYFDRVTNRVFFKDAYDSQELLGNLNRTLVLSTEIEELLTKSSLLIQENLKTSFATFFIRSTSYFPDRIIGAHSDDPTDKDAEKIQELASKVPKKVIYVESYADTNHDKELYRLLKKSDIDILVRLVSTVDLDIKGIGYIFMGPKKSGNLYTKQDLKLLEIIANELVIAVENVLRFEEIEQFNVTLQKKIDAATRELKKNNEKLKALDEAKDEFVSMASHQLRTPLTSIKGYISMVLEGDAGKISATQKQMLGQALFSSQRMVYLISDLLNVSRLRTGKFLIEAKPVYLPDLVDSEINQLVEGAKSKNITMSFVKPKKFASMKLDDMKIRQVVMNFIDNAIYYTPSNGKITVSLKETQKTVEFRVKDTGIGVPKEQVSKLFTKFYRADNARKARPDGTGLGLFMAKKVIIAQGGSIIIESKENKGSTFGFTFPKSRLQVAGTIKK